MFSQNEEMNRDRGRQAKSMLYFRWGNAPGKEVPGPPREAGRHAAMQVVGRSPLSEERDI